MNVNVNKDTKKLTHPTPAANARTSMSASQDNFLVVRIPSVLIQKEATHAYVMKDTLVILTLVVDHLVMVSLAELIHTVRYTTVYRLLACATKDSPMSPATSLLDAWTSTSATASTAHLECVAKEPFAPMYLDHITATVHPVSLVIPSATVRTLMNAQGATDHLVNVVKEPPAPIPSAHLVVPAKLDSLETHENLVLTLMSAHRLSVLMVNAVTLPFAPTHQGVFHVVVHPVHLGIHLFSVLLNIPVKVTMRVQEMPCVKTASATAHLLSLERIVNVSDLSFLCFFGRRHLASFFSVTLSLSSFFFCRSV